LARKKYHYIQINQYFTMKKIFLLTALVWVFLTADAQFLLGGNISLSVSGGKTVTGDVSVDSPSAFSFGLHPMAGFYIGDRFALGGRFDLGFSASNNNAATPTSKTTVSWGVTPFARLYFPLSRKFAIVGEGALSISGASTKTKTGSTTTDAPTLAMGFNVRPLLSYSVSNNISLEISSKFLNLGINNTVVGDDPKKVTTELDFGINPDNLVGTIGAVTLGAVFKF
jgi:hypothetical protein